MQNKANFQKSQMNVTPIVITDYEEKSDWTPSENEPNSKPNKANFKRDLANMGHHENFGQNIRNYFRIWVRLQAVSGMPETA